MDGGGEVLRRGEVVKVVYCYSEWVIGCKGVVPPGIMKLNRCKAKQ